MRPFFLFALPLYALDQVTKYLTLKHIPFGDSVTVIPNFFSLVHVSNTGAAFGMLQHNNAFFIALATLAIVVLVILRWRGAFRGRAETAAWALLLSGVAGNLTDRLLHGSVVDFLSFILPFYGEWPAFNVADSCICVAAALLIGVSLFGKPAKVK